MKSSRLPMLVLPVLLLALVWLFPVRMMRQSTSAHTTEAAAAELQAQTLQAQVAAGNQAKADEAKLKGELKQIRDVLPKQATGVLTPVILKISDLAAKNNVRVTSQSQASPLATAGAAAAAAAPAAGGANAAGAASATAPIGYVISVQASGSLRNIIAFTADLPSTQRLFLESVQLTPDEDRKAIGMDGPVKATLQLKTYVDASAKATMDPPAKPAGS